MMSNLFADSRVGMVVGSTISAILILWILFSKSRGPLLPSYGLEDVLFFALAMLIPTLLAGAISGSIVEAILIRRYILTKAHFARSKVIGIIGCIVGGILSFPVGAFLGIVIGGPAGGAIGGWMTGKVAVGPWGIAAGIALGIATCIVLAVGMGAILGTIAAVMISGLCRTAKRWMEGG